MTDGQVKEASGAVQAAAGASAYMYGVNYDQERFKKDLDKAVKYVQGHRTVGDH